jgi:hypothetical protein
MWKGHFQFTLDKMNTGQRRDLTQAATDFGNRLGRVRVFRIGSVEKRVNAIDPVRFMCYGIR